jgi:hypothetical protein
MPSSNPGQLISPLLPLSHPLVSTNPSVTCKSGPFWTTTDHDLPRHGEETRLISAQRPSRQAHSSAGSCCLQGLPILIQSLVQRFQSFASQSANGSNATCPRGHIAHHAHFDIAIQVDEHVEAAIDFASAATGTVKTDRSQQLDQIHGQRDRYQSNQESILV